MKKCVLIYDDDQEMLFLCRAILEKSIYHVETLSRCENILADIEAIKPDIIFMDLWIPEIGGEKAVIIIKENKTTKNIPVIMFSANADVKTIYKKINADGYIEKPFDVLFFKETIVKYIL